MARLPVTSLKFSDIKTETALSGVNNLSGLNTDTVINVWSFYKPCKLQANPSTLVLEKVTDTAPYLMGEFRGYNHAAAQPFINAPSSPQTFYPSTDMSTGVMVTHNETNLKELSSDITHVMVKYYTDAARTSIITFVGGATYKLQAINFYSPATVGLPAWPTGYRNNTNGNNAPETSTILTGLDIPYSSLSNGMIVYATLWYASSGGSPIAKIPSGFNFQFTCRAATQPNVTIQTDSSVALVEPVWVSGHTYAIGDRVSYGGGNWRSLTAHTDTIPPSSGINWLDLTTAVYDQSGAGTHSATAVIGVEMSDSHVSGQTSWNFSFKPQAFFAGRTPPEMDVAGKVSIWYEFPLLSGTLVQIGSGTTSFTNGQTLSVTSALAGPIAPALAYDQDIVIHLKFTELVISGTY